MPRNYERTSTRGTWNKSDMKRAVEEVKKGGKIKEIAQTYSVPRTTLYRHLSGQLCKPTGSTHLGKGSVLGQENECELLNHVLEFERRGFPLTVNDIRKLAFEFATINNMPHKFSKETKMAGMDWWGGFRKRHSELLTIRKPQSLSIQRAIHLNRPVVNKFFKLLEEIMVENSVFGEPSRIYNVDETGLSLVPGVKNIVGRKGARYSSQITSGERGVSQTVVMAVSAAGDYVPPLVIFKGKRVNPMLQQGMPPGTVVKYSESGYMNKDIFLDWMQHFNNNKKSFPGKVVLILDGHGSHTRSIEVLDFAAENNIEMVSLPPHTSHYLQPLDKLHFKPLKDYYKEAVRVHLRNNPGVGITRLNFPTLFSQAYIKICTMKNAVLAFESTGIYPLDKDQIPEHAYAPSETTRVESIHTGDTSNSNQNVSDSSISAEDREPAEIDVGVSPCEEPRSSGVRVDESLPENDRSFEDILPYPKTSQRNKPPRKKSLDTGSRILTSEKYRNELSSLLGARNPGSESSEATRQECCRQKSQNKKPNAEIKKLSKRKKKVTEREASENFCGICEENFFDDEEEEGWIQCEKCRKWFHDICAGVYGKFVMSFKCEQCS